MNNECPRTNFKYLVKCYLRRNDISDLTKFDTKWNIDDDKPYISEWDYECAEPSYGNLMHMWDIYKNSIIVMKQDEVKEIILENNKEWILVMQIKFPGIRIGIYF